MKPVDKSEITRQLWNSVDAQFHRRTLAVCAAMLCFCGASLGALWFLDLNIVPMMTAVASAVVLPLIVWQMWKLLRIFRKPEHYIFFRTKLSAPKGNSKVVAFPVTAPDGRQCWTDRIFYIRNLNPLLSDWLDQTVTVAWNRETERVIVISK